MYVTKYLLTLVGKMIQAILATLGGVFALKKAYDAAAGYFQWALIMDPVFWIWLTVISAIIYCLVLVYSAFKLSRVAQVHGTDVRIKIRVGNMFNSRNSSYLITSNQTFDTDLKVITNSCLQGKVTQKFFSGSVNELDDKLNHALRGENFVKLTDKQKNYGKKQEYTLGTTARVEQSGKIFYFLALTKMNAAEVSQATREQIRGALPSVWQSIHSSGRGENLVCPVFGAGESKLSAESEALIRDIVRTAVPCLRDSKFCRNLTIVIHWKDFLRNKPNMVKLGDFLHQECRYGL